jgi:hypothetical protein
MVKLTREYYRCDRCRIEMVQPVRGTERGPTAFSLSALKDFGVAGENPIKWNDLCKDCNAKVGGIIRAALEDAARDRDATP